MIQYIDTIKIILLHPKYIKKTIEQKTGVLKNKTETIEVKDSLDYEYMKKRNYPVYILEKMTKDFEFCKKYPHAGTSYYYSIEYTLKQFVKDNMFCMIISVIKEKDNLCVIWSQGA